MTSYITITDAETDPEAPLTATLAKKWRDNPIAIVEGDVTAPHINGEAAARDSATLRIRLPVATVAAGEVESFQGQGGVKGSYTNNTTTNVAAHTYTIRSYSGTLRFKASHYSGTTGNTVYLELYKNNVLVQSYTTNTTSIVNRVNDVTVSVGDVIEWRHRAASSGIVSTVLNVGVFADNPYVTQTLYIRNGNI